MWPGDLVCVHASSLAIRYGTNEERWIRGPFVGLVLATKGTARQHEDLSGVLVDWYVVLFSGAVADDILESFGYESGLAGIYLVPMSSLTRIGTSDSHDGVGHVSGRWTG